MVEIIFLGTGGGRQVLISQERATAGFRIAGSRTIQVDPGPGYLHRCGELGIDKCAPDILLISHLHIDHANDANVVIEAMTDCGKRHRGAVFGERDALFGGEQADRAISRYHQKMVAEYASLSPGESAAFEGVGITGTPAHHYGNCSGFVVELDGVRLGYSGDTAYFEGLERAFAGCDTLVLNALRPRAVEIPWHFGSDSVVTLLRAMEKTPALVILQHFGKDMLAAGPEKEAEFVADETGVTTIAARDGSRFDLKGAD